MKHCDGTSSIPPICIALPAPITRRAALAQYAERKPPTGSPPPTFAKRAARAIWNLVQGPPSPFLRTPTDALINEAYQLGAALRLGR